MNLKSFWQSSRSTIISAIIAIIVIAGLFILFNVLPANQATKPAQKTEKKQEQTKETNKNAEAKKTEKPTEKKVKLPTKYTVVRGDHLWRISTHFYGSGYNWTLLASENKLANPDIIHAGNVLTIPKASEKTTARTHTVVRGDSLWSIAEKSYGTGFEWTKIRDANPGKIGLLPNGRPLITPGQVLAVP